MGCMCRQHGRGYADPDDMAAGAVGPPAESVGSDKCAIMTTRRSQPPHPGSRLRHAPSSKRASLHRRIQPRAAHRRGPRTRPGRQRPRHHQRPRPRHPLWRRHHSRREGPRAPQPARLCVATTSPRCLRRRPHQQIYSGDQVPRCHRRAHRRMWPRHWQVVARMGHRRRLWVLEERPTPGHWRRSDWRPRQRHQRMALPWRGLRFVRTQALGSRLLLTVRRQ
ncbi:hypothetical protein BU14_0245s0004 [Porphyra umbilicalis]|uniref:Uncharacterized protein n=1 Tax=Porphyra umbilicalis TaxID=2786 RepID=A0A1X6P2S9_PORUM|nr:hypothetical protein BU14_0245s0004 [Porphyra umbilicalis]|eukprot:OSX75222.1 hypothetical protein BU14_0245s0004 [Porphyra umbilicalis]